MSFLSWLFPAKTQRARASLPDSSGLSRAEATRPVSPDKNGAAAPAGANNAHAANRKNERMARREMLYNVVRESMVRAGVLSASYKFKVLSLDARGRQFLVMMDLAREFGGQTEGLAEIEALIAQSAKARYDILVSAVYWRVNEHVAVGQLRNQALTTRNSSPMPLESQPLPLEPHPAAVPGSSSMDATVSLGTRPAVVAQAVAAASVAPVVEPAVEPPRSPPRFQPIEADEVAAFKKALAAGVSSPAKVAAAAVAATAAASAVGVAAARTSSGPRNITLLTGYEETEMPDPDMPVPALSGTQYGDLM